jgi:hypothetical protein
MEALLIMSAGCPLLPSPCPAAQEADGTASPSSNDGSTGAHLLQHAPAHHDGMPGAMMVLTAAAQGVAAAPSGSLPHLMSTSPIPRACC